MAQLGGIGGRLFHLGGMGRSLRLEEGVGSGCVLVVAEQFVFELRTGAVERARELFDRSSLLVCLRYEEVSARLPLPSLTRETLLCVRCLASRVSGGLLRPQHLLGRFSPDRRDQRIVPRHVGLHTVEVDQRVHESGTHAVEAPPLPFGPERPWVGSQPSGGGQPPPARLRPMSV